MLTKKDRQLLVQDFKEVFATKDDLNGLAKQADLLAVKKDLPKRMKKLEKYFESS